MTAIRWIARIIGLLLVGLVLLIMVGEGFNPLALNRNESGMTGAFLVALVGMLLLWRWEGIGGIVALAGMVAFYAVNYAASGRFPSGWVFPVCFLPGILSLTSWSLHRVKRPPERPTGSLLAQRNDS